MLRIFTDATVHINIMYNVMDNTIGIIAVN